MGIDDRPLQARLLGGLSFAWCGEQLTPQSRKGAALLALLTLRPTGVEREDIAELLWEPGKLASVRQALYELRKLSGAHGWLVEDGSLVSLRAESDVAAFEAAVRSEDSEAAVASYTGPLLDGFKDLGVPAFSDWLAGERERLADMHLSALRREIARLEREGQLGAARSRVQEALKYDPLDESLYRTGMRLAYAQGDLGRASELYARCVRMTREEFGTAPSAETKQLGAAIEREEPLPLTTALTGLPTPLLRLLQALAVGGGALGVHDIAVVVERDSFEVATDIAALEARGLVNRHLSADPRILAQVLTSLPIAMRRLLHERIADVLVTDDNVDDAVVARHLLAAAKPAAAAPRFLRAAQAAVGRSDLAGAVDNLFRLLWADPGSDSDSVRLDGVIMLEGIASQLARDELRDAALDEAERLAWSRQSDAHLAEVALRKSRTEIKRGRLGEALEHALEALAVGHRLEDDTLIARARNAAGGVQFYSGDLDGAAASFRSNLAVANEIERFRANNNLGSLCAMRGDLAEAYACFDRALTLARAHASKAEVAATLNNLAATAERMSDYGRAVKHFRDGLDLTRRDKASAMEGQLLVNLAVVYTRQGNLGPAWNTVLEVEELAEQQNDARLMVHVLEQKAEVLRHCGVTDEALELIRQAASGAESLGDERKALALKAQHSVLALVGGNGVFEDTERAIEALATVRLADIAPWLWIELALHARHAGEVASLLQRNGGKVTNRHMRLLADAAVLRSALLPDGAGGNGVESVARLTGVVVGVGGAERSDLVSLEVAERPYGWWLVEQWLERYATTIDVSQACAFREAVAAAGLIQAQLEQQSLGLPKSMRESLQRLPLRWTSALS